MQLTKEEIDEHEERYKDVRNQYKAQLHKIRQEQVGMQDRKDVAVDI